MSCSKAYRGTLRRDPRNETRVEPKTPAHYRLCALKFAEYNDDYENVHLDSADWDDFLIQIQ